VIKILKIIIGCERSQVVTNAFRELGHEAYSCDILDSEQRSNYHIKDDVLNHLEDGWDFAGFHPPCPFLCVTGNKWFYHPDDKDLPIEQRRPHPKFPNRKQHRKVAIDFFMKLANAPIKKIYIENPIGIMSSLWRKPNQIIQPFQFGHPEPKKTCLWLKDLKNLIPTKIVEPEYHITASGKRVPKWFFSPSPSEKRTADRERTFQGIAVAMAAQWGKLI